METIAQEATPILTIHWQKIETAPKDGTHIIVVVQGFTPAEAHWDLKNERWIDDSLEDWEDNLAGEWEVTHWIPMPEFP